VATPRSDACLGTTSVSKAVHEDGCESAVSAGAEQQVAFVLWSGHLGGAETFTAELVGILRRRYGIDARIVFVCHSGRLARRLDELRIPYQELGLHRGRDVLLHPRHLARLARSEGADCAVLVSSGYLAASLRLGGYHSPIAAVEHGSLLQVAQLPFGNRFLRRLDRVSGIWACEAEIAVSSYAFRELQRHRHARRLTCIQNGVDLARFTPRKGGAPEGHPFTVGYAGRLVASKGVADVIRAFASGTLSHDSSLLVAGDGPERQTLADLASELGVRTVHFVGQIDDVPAFWRSCDAAVVPSAGSVESFCLAAVEAMACGLPVVAARAGALPEVIEEGTTGILVEQGNSAQLAQALERYARDPALRHLHGTGGRRLCEQRYNLADTARAYLELIGSLLSLP
jgi:glycosyltransferase involved in cell wall biosynthesis